MRNLLIPLQRTNLIYGFYFRTQTTMNAKYLLINQLQKSHFKLHKNVIQFFFVSIYCSHRQQIENTTAVLPSVHIAIFCQTLIVKTINLGDLSAFVVAPQQRDFIRIFRFQRQQSGKRLQTVIPPIHKIPQENVICIGHLAPFTKQLFQIIKLNQTTG